MEFVTAMIERVVFRKSLRDESSSREDLAYWMSRTPEERIAAVTYLRMQQYPAGTRMERVARVVKRSATDFVDFEVRDSGDKT
jgi:hypothetical protein